MHPSPRGTQDDRCGRTDAVQAPRRFPATVTPTLGLMAGLERTFLTAIHASKGDRRWPGQGQSSTRSQRRRVPPTEVEGEVSGGPMG